MSVEHKESAPVGRDELVSLSVQQPGGAIYKLSGQAAGGTPVLVAINDAMFTQPASLKGDILVYKSKSNTQVLGAVVGM